jgi:hypothetical protein
MDRTCSTYRGEKRCIQGLAYKSDGRKHLGRHNRRWMGGIDWIDLAQDRDRWRAFMNTVMNLGVKMRGIS